MVQTGRSPMVRLLSILMILFGGNSFAAEKCTPVYEEGEFTRYDCFQVEDEEVVVEIDQEEQDQEVVTAPQYIPDDEI